MGNTLSSLIFHSIFSTKNREELLSSEICSDLYKYIGGIVIGEGGIFLEIGGMPDHDKFRWQDGVGLLR